MSRKVTLLEVFKFARGYWVQMPYYFGVVLGLTLLSVLLEIQVPIYAGKMIDALTSAISGEVTRDVAMAAAVKALVIFSSLGVGFSISLNLMFRFWVIMSALLIEIMMKDSFADVQRFSTEWHQNSFAGSTVRKVTRGMGAFETFGDVIVIELFPTLIVIIGMTAILAVRWPMMGLFVFVMTLIYVAVSIFQAIYLNAPRNRAAKDEDTRLGGVLADAITCNAVVKSFGAERREEDNVAIAALSWRDKTMKSWMMMVTTGLIQHWMSLIMQIGLLSMALYLWGQEKLDAGDIALVLTSYMLLNGFLRNVGNNVRKLQKSANELEDLIIFAEENSGIEDADDAKDLKVEKGEIFFDDVTFGYGNLAAPLYRDFDLTIREGEKVALVGHSGSGKSTFVKLLQRLYDVEGGSITVDGEDIRFITQESLRQQISLVHQEPLLFHRSLAENISYGRPDASMDEIIEASKKAHAHEFVVSLPDAYDTMVGERGVKLSGGERQRIALARAILADAPVLILDEATSALDSISEALIQEAIAVLIEGRTTIMVAHRLSTIKAVDRILVFDRGRIVEQGSHRELVTKEGGHYHRLFEMQALGLID